MDGQGVLGLLRISRGPHARARAGHFCAAEFPCKSCYAFGTLRILAAGLITACPSFCKEEKFHAKELDSECNSRNLRGGCSGHALRACEGRRQKPRAVQAEMC